MANGSLEDLFEVHERESIDELFEEAFRDLKECRSLAVMKARKASTPAKEIDSRGLVPQGEGGTVVRIPWRQVHQASPEAGSPGFPGGRFTRLPPFLIQLADE